MQSNACTPNLESRESVSNGTSNGTAMPYATHGRGREVRRRPCLSSARPLRIAAIATKQVDAPASTWCKVTTGATLSSPSARRASLSHVHPSSSPCSFSEYRSTFRCSCSLSLARTRARALTTQPERIRLLLHLWRRQLEFLRYGGGHGGILCWG